MAGYNCTVEYIAGKENTCADLLSRKPDGGHSKAEAKPFEVDIDDNTFEAGVIEQTSPVTFVIENQLNGKTIKAHAGHLKLTKIHDWEIPLTVTGKPQQKANFVVAPKSDDSEETEGLLSLNQKIP